jgi:glycosyltransferase involved in cell wall biosynthesis
MISIISITKNDYQGIISTVISTKGLRDTYSVEQLIIDGSDQEVAQKVKKFVVKQKHCRYIRAASPGISKAFNLGITQAKHQWIWCLNGGDQMYNKVDTDLLINILKATSSHLLIFEIILKNTNEIRHHPPLWDQWPPSVNWIPHPATLVKKVVFEKYGMFSEKYRIAMDGEFWLRVLSTKIVPDLISIPITVYDQSGVSSIYTKLTRSEQLHAIQQHWKIIFLKWLQSGAKNFYYNDFLQSMRALTRSR